MATVTAYIVMNQIWPYYHRTIIMVSRLDMDNNLGSHQSLVVFYESDRLLKETNLTCFPTFVIE